jgi:hypothetical protein
LLVSNFKGPDGRLYFDDGQVGWRARLVGILGSKKPLLGGAYLVTASADTRLCIACPTREARGALLAALRSSKAIKVSPALDDDARRNKRMAVAFARQNGL